MYQWTKDNFLSLLVKIIITFIIMIETTFDMMILGFAEYTCNVADYLFLILNKFLAKIMIFIYFKIYIPFK